VNSAIKQTVLEMKLLIAFLAIVLAINFAEADIRDRKSIRLLYGL